MICNTFVFREVGKALLLDLDPGLGPALSCVSHLLLWSHVCPADPVLVLCLTFQIFYHVSFHLPRDRSVAAVLPDPLLSRDAFPQQSQGKEHL